MGTYLRALTNTAARPTMHHKVAMRPAGGRRYPPPLRKAIVEPRKRPLPLHGIPEPPNANDCD